MQRESNRLTHTVLKGASFKEAQPSPDFFRSMRYERHALQRPMDIGPTIPIQCLRPSCGRHLATAFADNDSGSLSAPLRALLLQSLPTFNLPTPGVEIGPILHGGSKRTEEDESVARDSSGTRAYSPVQRY